MSFCSNCGAKLPPGSRFCSECGTAVIGKASGQPVGAAVLPGAVRAAPAVTWHGSKPAHSAKSATPIPAGLVRRAIAQLLDALIAAFFLLYFLERTATGEVTLEIVIMTTLAWLGYFILMEAFLNGQTLGKKLCGIRVVACDGGKAGFFRILLRNLIRVIDGLGAYLVGLLIALASKSRQRLGDHLAGTMVTRTATEEPDR